MTLPLILARDRDPDVAAIDLRALDPDAAEEACDRIVATGATDDVRDLARAEVAAAKSAIEDAALDPERRRLLDLVADGVVERYS